MEYLEGEDLGERLARVGKLSAAETTRIATQIGRALSKAHPAGLVHRDLKPANVFLVRDDEHETAKVLDFGVAKVKDVGLDGATKTGAVLGTPYYMSPEQARNSKGLDHRSDLWALAVVVFQCVTGRLPFVATTLAELMVKIVVDDIPIPSEVAVVPPGFDAWWARAASRDPALRFQTAKELVEALGLALGVTVSDTGDGFAPSSRQISSGSPELAPGMMGSQSGVLHVGAPPSQFGATPPPGTPVPSGTPVPMGTPVPAMVTMPAMGAAPTPTPLQHAISVSSAGGPPARTTSRGIAAGVIAGAVLIGSVVGVIGFRAASTSSKGAAVSAATTDGRVDPPSPAPPPASVASAPTPPSVESAAAPSTVASAPAASATPTASAQDRPASAPASRKPAPAAAPAPAPPKAGNCDPNYTLDANGQKHFKAECFK
jgi:serine/threonine-protein kinase